MTGESLQLCFLLPRRFLGYLLSNSGRGLLIGIVNSTFVLALAQQQVYEGPQITVDWASGRVLSFGYLANRLTISIQTPDKAASAWGGQCLHRALMSQEVRLFQPPPATVKLIFVLPCFLYLFTLKHRNFKSEIMTHPNYEETNRSDGQYSVNEEVKKAEEGYSQDLINTWKLNSIASLSCSVFLSII